VIANPAANCGAIGLAATPEDVARESVRPHQFLLSVVVPCFNEEELSSLTYRRLIEVLGNRDFRLQIVFVDDGNTDRTSQIVANFSQQDARVESVLLSRNFGHQAAVSAGLANANGDAVVVMDADLQGPPEVILQMIERWAAGVDVVYGIRTKRKEPLFRRTGYGIFYRVFQRLTDIDALVATERC
jgi:polyisoprenyl-phosphate glycosyltransferase